MRAAVLNAPFDVTVETLPDPVIQQPTDAIIRVAAACVCGSDLWDYRGINPVSGPHQRGHEYVGVVEEVGSAVTTIRPGQFVVGSFVISDNTCPACRIGYQSSCQHREFVGAAQAELLRIPLADGTLVATDGRPDADLIPSLLAASDVFGTGWYAADAANVQPGGTVAVVGDGAVGLLGVLSARTMGAGRIIIASRNPARQALATTFGATDIITGRGDDAIAAVKELTGGVGADSVLECVGTQESMLQAIGSARSGGWVGVVGVPHSVSLEGQHLFFNQIHLHAGPAPVRRFLPDLMGRIQRRELDPGKVFDLELPLERAADGYAAMDTRTAIKALLRP